MERPPKAPSEDSFVWNDHSGSKMQDEGRGPCPLRMPRPSPCWVFTSPAFYSPRKKKKKKGPSAEFSCVNLPNPRPWHFCFGSQTLLVFPGVFVLLKDIIKPFFSL